MSHRVSAQGGPGSFREKRRHPLQGGECPSIIQSSWEGEAVPGKKTHKQLLSQLHKGLSKPKVSILELYPLASLGGREATASI